MVRGALTTGLSLGVAATAAGSASASPLPTTPRWDHSPSVVIRSTGAPTVPDEEDGTVSGVLLAEDAISDYWDDDGNPDGENDRESEQNVPASWTTFDEGGFGDVDTGSGSADVVVRWADLPTGTLGSTSVSRSDRETLGHATVTITTDVSTFSLTDEDYKNVIAHELGHAIGLNHSGSPGTLMHPFERRIPAYKPLGNSSIVTLDHLYG